MTYLNRFCDLFRISLRLPAVHYRYGLTTARRQWRVFGWLSGHLLRAGYGIGAVCCSLLLSVNVAAMTWPLLAGSAVQTVTAPPLRASVMQGMRPPFAQINDDPTQGIVGDFYRLLAQATGITVEISVLPKSQIESQLVAGNSDLYCLSAPRWFKAPQLLWSPALLRVNDILVTRAEYTNLADFELRYRGQIGTVRGYVYTELSPSLLEKRRADADTPELALQNFVAARTDAVIVSEAISHYYRETATFSQFPLYENSIHCAFSPRLDKSTLTLLNSRIRELARENQFGAIYLRYSGTGTLAKDQ